MSNMPQPDGDESREAPPRQLVFLGKPATWKRPEFITRKGSNGRFHRSVTTNKAMKAATEAFQDLAKDQLTGELPSFTSGKLVGVTIWFCTKPNLDYFVSRDGKRLKSKWQKFSKRNSIPFVKVEKPDLDNMVKFVLDAMNGILWSDDDQVVLMRAQQCVDLFPPFKGRTVIEAKELPVESNLMMPVPWWGLIQANTL